MLNTLSEVEDLAEGGGAQTGPKLVVSEIFGPT